MQCSGDKSAGDGDMAQLAHAIAIRYKHVLNYATLFVSDPCSFAECWTIT